MKTIYQIVIQDKDKVHQNIRVSASSMADAIMAAQKKYGVTTEPVSIQVVGALDITA